MILAPLPRDFADAQRAAATGRGRWAARLDLAFTAAPDKTIVHRRHVGPMLVQRPFYPEGDGTCHSYILHPPGGVVGGDSLDLSIEVATGARCVLTAPGATKFYRAPGATSQQRVAVRVAPGAVCEYLPMETIVFDGANAHVRTDVHLEGDATFVGWDIVSLGRPAAGEDFANGGFAQRTTIARDGRPIWFERAAIDGGAPILTATHGFQGRPIFGAMVYAGALPDDAADLVRARMAPVPNGQASVSQLEDVLVCRYSGSKVSSARAFFVTAWDILRRLGQGKPAANPRIWAT